ncbi:hypothetical protein PENNAL_c0005G04138 [Penicillium nalgiovense]|uniref:Uncharacterized protein n=1 Tax=Penicillium nalgiovense TaxID=60175 RepID=A0A1V6Z2S2_PENNA|nr:hypothetical protein PENNAL_c0005G04138 [Penicillium nalgiovense]
MQVTALFAVGLFIAITIARLPQNAKTSTARVNRTTWASIELLAAAIDANAPVLYGLLKGQSEKSKNAALGVGSTGPPQGLQKRSVNESEFELQGVRLGHIEGRLWEIEPPKVQLGQLQRTG